jgi:predicted aspartyl protease
VPICQSPSRNPRDLKIHGPRLKITIGHPILNPIAGQSSAPQQRAGYSTETDALIDTGAQRTVLAPEAVQKVGLSTVNEVELRVVGSIITADVYVASLQFPRCGLRTIDVIEVSCCKLPHPLYRCLIGRDVLSRWVFNYDGPLGTWQITENAVPGWVEPPEGSDPDVWGE